jgi:hypothetical protein
LDENTERKIITAMLKEISASYGVKINLFPNLERGMATPVEENSGGQIILIGASHVYRTAEYLPAATITLATPSFKPSKEKIVELEHQIDRLDLNESDTVVLALLSNTAYMGTNDDGLPLPAYRAGDGSYHIIGTLKTTPPTTIKKPWICARNSTKKMANLESFWFFLLRDMSLENVAMTPNTLTTLTAVIMGAT